MNLKLAAIGAVAFVLTACAQQEEPTPVYAQPTYDKVGNATCPAGYQIASTTEGATVCAPVTQ